MFVVLLVCFMPVDRAHMPDQLYSDRTSMTQTDMQHHINNSSPSVSHARLDLGQFRIATVAHGKNLELQALSARRRLIRRGSNRGKHFRLWYSRHLGNEPNKTSDPGCSWDMSLSTEPIVPSLNVNLTPTARTDGS